MRRPGWILLGLVTAAALGLAWQAGWFDDRTHESDSGVATSRLSGPVRPDGNGVVAASAGDPLRRADESLRSRELEAETFGRFDTWAARYLAQTDATLRATSLADGVALARARRATLRELIAQDPERALRHAVPWSMRRGMPREVQELLEARVDGIGAYRAVAALAPAAGDAAEFRAARREVEIDGRTFDTFTYGRRLELGSRGRLAVHGIAIDERLALLDSPVRVLEAGEPVPANRRVEEICAVSKKPTDAGTGTAVDTGDRVIYLCSAGHISLLASQLESAEVRVQAADGAASTVDVTPGGDSGDSVVGTRRVLMIRVRFADQPSSFQPESDDSAAAVFAAANAFYQENSYGALGIQGTVSPVYTLPQPASWYVATDTSGYALNVLTAARAVAADPASLPGNEGLPAFNYLDFDFEAVRYTTGPGAFSGQGFVAMRGCWIKSPDAGVMIHELGHNLGLWHANAWNAADWLAPLDSGTNAEYGDAFDTMGPARGGAWHFNAWEKHRLGWISDDEVASPGADATIALGAHDLGGARAAGRARAIRVVRDEDREYWIELRRNAGWLASRPDVRGGVGVRWDPWARSNGGTQLIDTTPGSPAGRDDATLAIGRTFGDPAAGIFITPVAADPGDPDAVDVEVRVGASPGNRPPVVAVTASSVSAAVGQSIQFSATASDPDGDALSFAWSFDESAAGASGPIVSHAWSVEGDARARVTVSDRRGGTATASFLVRVGTASGTRITGRVFDLDGTAIPGVLVSNTSEPGADGYCAAWSDADGTFTLLGVPPGTWNLCARAPGWIFAIEGFSHPVSTPQDTGNVTILGCWKGFSITGAVRHADGSPVSGAIVRSGDHAEPTDRWGEFTITGLPAGRHELSVTAPDASFDPRTVEVGQTDVASVYLTEKTFTVSGYVAGGSDAAVTVTTGWQSALADSGAATTSGERRFTITGVPAGTWALRAVSAVDSFSPQGFIDPLAVSGDTSDILLAGDTQPRHAVSGTITDRGLGLAGVRVVAGAVSTLTDSRGCYWLGGLTPEVHEVIAAADGYHFVSDSRTVDVTAANVSGVDFVTDRVNAIPVVDTPEVIGPHDQPFVTLRAAATDDDGTGTVRFWWSVAGESPGEVEFSRDGANAASETIARFSSPGEYTLRVTAVDRFGAEQSRDISLDVHGGGTPPTIVEAARAEPAVIGADLQTRLSVRAASAGGDEALTYTWLALAPDGSSSVAAMAGPVVFSINGTSAARETTAHFRKPGNYLLKVIVRDPAGQSVESSVAVRVELTYESWLGQHFAEDVLADPELRPAVWGDLADPDGDNFANLLEYAFGGDPGQPSTEARPVTHFVTDGGIEYLAVSFKPNPDAVDLVYEPQVSSDLENWQAGLVFMPGDDERTLTYRDFSPAADHQRRFIRVNVSHGQAGP